MKFNKNKLKNFFGLNNKSPTSTNRKPIHTQLPVGTKTKSDVIPVKPIRKSELQTSTQEPKMQKTMVKHVDHKKEFLKIFKRLEYCHNSYDVWNDFITMFACSISNAVDKTHFDNREELYLSRIKKYKDIRERELFPKLAAEVTMALEDDPERDFLGDMFMTLGLGNKSNGQFFTPYHISQFMAAITMGDIQSEIKEKGYVSVHDSCCGAGAMLIAAINESKTQLEKEGINFQNHTLITGQDIDQIVALMCYIQISLLGVAGYIKVGNALTEPMDANDTLDNYWFTPMYFSDIWTFRRFFRNKTLL